MPEICERLVLLIRDDEEHKDIIKNAMRKLERHMDTTTSCKNRPSAARSRETGATFTKAKASEKVTKATYNCVIEAHESTRQ